MNKIFKSKTGASVVEFAFVLPLLLVIVFGIVEFGTLLYNQQIITNASREGARKGIVAQQPRVPGHGAGSIDETIQKYCSARLFTFSGIKNPPQTEFPDGHNSGAVFGDDLKVRVTYNFEFLVIPNFIPGINKLRTLRAETLMKYE